MYLNRHVFVMRLATVNVLQYCIVYFSRSFMITEPIPRFSNIYIRAIDKA